MRRERFEYCNCACHKGDRRMKHIVACCYPCRICRRKIRRGYHAAHESNCEKDHLREVVEVIEEERRTA